MMAAWRDVRKQLGGRLIYKEHCTKTSHNSVLFPLQGGDPRPERISVQGRSLPQYRPWVR